MPTPRIEDRWDTDLGSESFGSGEQEKVYVVADAADHVQAVELAANTAPLSLTTPLGLVLVRQTFAWDIEEGDLWMVSVRYGVAQPPGEGGQAEINFDTSGGSEKITHGFSNAQNVGAPGVTPFDHKGAIGVTKDGVEGTEIAARSFKWTETHVLPANLLLFSAYSQVLELLTGTINFGQFRGRPPQACLFHGAQGGAKVGAETGSVQFHFEAGRHVTNLTVGEITGINKKAWQYLWFKYDDKEDPAANQISRRAISAHVDDVYLPADWSLLGIGS